MLRMFTLRPMSQPKKFFVTAATGAIGSSVCRQLLDAGHRVNALVRDKSKPAAKDLDRHGAILVQGSFDDLPLEAMDGCYGVFLCTQPGNDEVQQAHTIVNAAKKVNVEVIVCSTVIRAEEYETFPRLDDMPFMRPYWTGKAGVEEVVQASGMQWTILQPSYFTTNLLDTQMYFPEMKKGTLSWAISTEAKIDLIVPEDIGAFAAAALTQPSKFKGQRIRLASQQRSMEEIARIISEVTGKQIHAEIRKDAEEALKKDPTVWAQVWQTEAGLQVDLDRVHAFDVRLTSIESYMRGKKDVLLAALE